MRDRGNWGTYVRDAAGFARNRMREGTKAASDKLDGWKRHTDANRERISKGITDSVMATASRLDQSADKADSLLSKYDEVLLDRRSPGTADIVLKGSLNAASALRNGLRNASAWTVKSAPAVGEATSAALTQVVTTASGAVDAFAISQSDLEAVERRLELASRKLDTASQENALQIEAARSSGRRGELLDLLVVGGVTLGAVASASVEVPPEIDQAFALAYPGLAASGETFADAVTRLPPEELTGLVSGVKGKLFELQLVEQLNNGELPEGASAVLASSPAQPGYDIQILGPEGQVLEHLQAKATDSVAYVREALERYPNIDIVTTSEVHSMLMEAGMADRVADSGITVTDLDQSIQAAATASPGLDLIDLAPSSLGLAIIAYSAFSDQSLTVEERSSNFGSRGARAAVSGSIGGLAMVATNTWWLALAAGLGSQSIAEAGARKRERYETLKTIAALLEAEASSARDGLR